LVFFKVFSVKLHLMSRIVRQLNAAPDGQEEGKPRPFSDFADYPNIVLLGDPGAGKTYLFKKAAAEEGARLIKARAFLVTPPNSLSGQSLYIDGLDEKRAGRGDRDTVDDLVEKLFAVNPPRVRISCRAADWLGESDLASFRPYFEQRGDPPVLLLESLSTEEQIAVLAGEGVDAASAAKFLAEANERTLGDFLQNPQNLIMLWRAVQTGSWPKTRKQLFELSTGLMMQEFDQDHARARGGKFSVAELRPVAGAICAARLISDVDAISLTDQEGTVDIPGYRALTWVDPKKAQAALGRRIFVIGSEPETVDYAHRTTAEYLAAALLATKVREGLPLPGHRPHGGRWSPCARATRSSCVARGSSPGTCRSINRSRPIWRLDLWRRGFAVALFLRLPFARPRAAIKGKPLVPIGELAGALDCRSGATRHGPGIPSLTR
jgi:predicted NACHT family NTPase